MSELNWDLLQPLRLAAGSHQKGSGYGCGMNVVSYINGDTEITDYPACSDGKLSRLVQTINDVLAQYPEGVYDEDRPALLSPEDAVAVIELGVLTMGTGDGESYRRPDDEDLETPGLLGDAIRSVRDYSRAKHQTFCACEGYTISEADLKRYRDRMIVAAREAIMDRRRELGLDQAPEVDTKVLQENML